MDNFERDQKVSYADEIRGRLQEHLIKNSLNASEIAKETGVHLSTLNLWLNGKLQGYHSWVSEVIEQYLDFWGDWTNKVGYTFSQGRFETLPDEGTKFYLDAGLLEEDINEYGTLIPIKIDYETEGKKKDLLMLEWGELKMTYESLLKSLNENHEIV